MGGRDISRRKLHLLLCMHGLPRRPTLIKIDMMLFLLIQLHQLGNEHTVCAVPNEPFTNEFKHKQIYFIQYIEYFIFIIKSITFSKLLRTKAWISQISN